MIEIILWALFILMLLFAGIMIYQDINRDYGTPLYVYVCERRPYFAENWNITNDTN